MSAAKKKQDKKMRELEAKRWALVQLQNMTTSDREKMPCCFEYRALHAHMPPFPSICPPPGTSDRLDELSLDDI